MTNGAFFKGLKFSVLRREGGGTGGQEGGANEINRFLSLFSLRGMGWNLIDFIPQSLLDMPQIMALLNSQPQARAIAAKFTDAHSHLRRNGMGAGHDSVQCLPGHTKLPRRFTYR